MREWTNQKPVSRSRGHSWPIRDSYSSITHVTAEPGASVDCSDTKGLFICGHFELSNVPLLPIVLVRKINNKGSWLFRKNNQISKDFYISNHGRYWCMRLFPVSYNHHLHNLSNIRSRKNRPAMRETESFQAITWSLVLRSPRVINTRWFVRQWDTGDTHLSSSPLISNLKALFK